MANYTVPELSEMAVMQLPRAVRGAARRKLARREKKLELTAHLCSEFESVEIQMEQVVAGNSGADLLATPISIDPENLQAILDAIIRFITELAPLIKLLIDLLGVMLFICLLTLPSTAVAQCSGSSNTVSSLVSSQGRMGILARVRANRQARVQTRLASQQTAAASCSGSSQASCSGSSMAAPVVQVVPMQSITPVQSVAPIQYNCVNGQCYRVSAITKDPCGCEDCNCVDCDCADRSLAIIREAKQELIAAREESVVQKAKQELLAYALSKQMQVAAK
jgi:hypothetical protein